MAEYGEWNRKGATLSDVSAVKEYEIDRRLIVKGIREGRLEYREGAVSGKHLRLIDILLNGGPLHCVGSDRRW